MFWAKMLQSLEDVTMGKTLYEFIFGEQFKCCDEKEEQKKGIFAQDTLLQNEEFRTILMNDDTTERGRRKSRFRLSRNATECLLGIMRGLCQQDNNISFEQAERMMLTFLSDR